MEGPEARDLRVGITGVMLAASNNLRVVPACAGTTPGLFKRFAMTDNPNSLATSPQKAP